MPKISELTALSTPTLDDLVPAVDDPGGTPSTRKLTLAALAEVVLFGQTVSITDAATLDSSHFGRTLVCTGSTAYTITLPAASGNAGKWIAFEFGPTSDAIITLAGDGSETIGGRPTRSYIAGENVVIRCDGTSWRVVSEYLQGVYLNVDRGGVAQTLGTSGAEKIQHNNVVEDSHGWYDASTTYRFTPKAPGLWMVVCECGLSQASNDGTYVECQIRVNGVEAVGSRIYSPNNGAFINVPLAWQVRLNGSTDYLEHWVNHTHPANRTLNGSAARTYFHVRRISL